MDPRLRLGRLFIVSWTPLAPLENLPLIHLSEIPALGTGWTPLGCANAIVAYVALLVASLSAFITCRATYWPQVRPAARRLIRRAKRRREDEAGPAPAPGGRLYPHIRALDGGEFWVRYLGVVCLNWWTVPPVLTLVNYIHSHNHYSPLSHSHTL